ALSWAGVDRLAEPEAVEQRHVLARAVARHRGVTFLTTTRAWEPTGLPAGSLLRLAVPRPAFPERRELWRTMLPPADAFRGGEPTRAKAVEQLANVFRLSPGQIKDAIGTALGVARLRDPATPLLTLADLTEGCRRRAGRGLVSFARRLSPRPHLTMDDLVLPRRSRTQLEELHHRIAAHGRVIGELGFGRRLALGRGVVAMFTGGPGTGKTMAAELLAQRHGLDLYKVDIAAVASRWVGETEKNLDRIFDDAAKANAMLFFDEADALFAKRGEVREAKDRWANVEMSFLLQRIEEYEGVVVLATNLPTNIDGAFFRRVHVLVDFPAPDADERLRIWRGLIPAELTYPSPADLADLAKRFPLSGGSITNVVVDAAFRAVAADPTTTTVTLRDVVVSVGREYQKAGLPITPAEFGPTYFDWVHEHLFPDATGS
ncbi:MAG: ATP-binding protein, partial [Saccharothrix sp.]|nr:ATP-binding protein [Saccharothrix sp.]